MIRIVLVDDHRIIIDSLSVLFDTMQGVEVVGTFDDSRQVLPFLKENQIDVLVTDLTMPFLDGIALTVQVKQVFPSLKVLMLTVNDTPDLIRDAFLAGVAGYVIKKAGRKELERAIYSVAKGNLYYSQEVMATILAGQDAARMNDKAILSSLTQRELEILRLLVAEKSSSQIAGELYISIGTVENHRYNLFKKLGVSNVVGAVKFALKYKLVD
jgi:DNA-binding NarL/FixJ family response regulator